MPLVVSDWVSVGGIDDVVCAVRCECLYCVRINVCLWHATNTHIRITHVCVHVCIRIYVRVCMYLVCVYACVCAHLCGCLCLCLCIHDVYACTGMYVYIFAYVSYTCMYVYESVRKFVCCAYVSSHVNVYVRAGTCMYMHECTTCMCITTVLVYLNTSMHTCTI